MPEKDIEFLVNVIESHPAVIRVDPIEQRGTSSLVTFYVCVELPRDFAEDGQTDKGVRNVEPVTLFLADSFPISAPIVFLREDFNRAHPHINPEIPGLELVNPCISEIPLGDLMHGPGWIDEIINQMVDWLHKAARDELIDSSQGWEPIRRDDVDGKLQCKSDELTGKALSSSGPGGGYLSFKYINETPWGYGGTLGSIKDLVYQAKKIDRIADFNAEGVLGNISHRNSIAIFIWNGSKNIVDRYFPETVTGIDSLLITAEDYGCNLQLKARLKELEAYFTKKEFVKSTLDIALVFAVTRPHKLIGHDSNIELIPYRLKIDFSPSSGFDCQHIEIKPLALIEDLSPKLLSQLSGRPDTCKANPRIVIAGCGSLGSKISLHLARAGFNKFRLIDNDFFHPHNNARYGLSWNGKVSVPKSSLLAHFLRELECSVENSSPADLIPSLLNESPKLLENSDCIIDTTASISVREAFSSLSSEKLQGRLVRAELYDNGAISFLSVEGDDRAPRIDDIAVEIYQLGHDDDLIGSHIYKRNVSERVNIGHSCGSFTMVMSDAELSLHSSLQAEIIQKGLDDGFSKDGLLVVIRKDKDNNEVGIDLRKLKPAKYFKIESSMDFPWEVRVSQAVSEKIEEQTNKFLPNENGGVLVGHISWSRRVIHVTSLIDAPEDSVRTPTKFILGTQGLREKLKQLDLTTNSNLTYLGTWHSHPMGGGASQTDINMLRNLIGERGVTPTICLLHSDDSISLIEG